MKVLNLRLVAALIAASLIAAAWVYFAQQRGMARLQAEKQVLEDLRGQLETSQQQQAATIQLRDQQIEQLRKDVAGIPRLRAEVSRLKRELEEATRSARNAEQGQGMAAAAQANGGEMKQLGDEDWKQSVARIRGKLFGVGGPPTPEELQWLRDAKPKIEQLERDPAQFAGFQSELIKATVPSLDATRLERVSEIIRRTYEAAVARGLDLPSKPSADTVDWVARRHALDRRGTGAVQALLSETERAQFDGRFLGVMGVDLGTGVDKANYPPGFLGDPPPARQ